MVLDNNLKRKLEIYIKLNYVASVEEDFLCPDINEEEITKSSGKKFEQQKQDLSALVQEAGESFHEMLFRLIEENNQVDKRFLSPPIQNKHQIPSLKKINFINNFKTFISGNTYNSDPACPYRRSNRCYCVKFLQDIHKKIIHQKNGLFIKSPFLHIYIYCFAICNAADAAIP